MAKNLQLHAQRISAKILESTRAKDAPMLVAIDGRSGSGKSTFARLLRDRLDATLLQGDDFYAGGVAIRAATPEKLVADCIDWRKQITVLEALKSGITGSFAPFDWAAFSGACLSTSKLVETNAIIILEGVYSARPELQDLVDFSILVVSEPEVRRRRLMEREGEISEWESQWLRAEDWYFERILDERSFQCVVAN